jgi:hypothetical protein
MTLHRWNMRRTAIAHDSFAKVVPLTGLLVRLKGKPATVVHMAVLQ